MKRLLVFAAVAAMVPTAVHAAVYMEYDSVRGESVATPKVSATPASQTVPARAVATPTPTPQGASDMYIKIDTIKGEATENEGSAIEPDEIDVADDGEPLTPDFSILLGGGGSSEAPSAETLRAVEQILMDGAAEQGAPAERISLNYEKIMATVAEPVKLFGLIPLKAKAEIEIDADGLVKVKFPWWAKLAAGADEEALGDRFSTTLSDVLKAKRDTVKNALTNIR